jgi:hypothetical protein
MVGGAIEELNGISGRKPGIRKAQSPEKLPITCMRKRHETRFSLQIGLPHPLKQQASDGSLEATTEKAALSSALAAAVR